MRGTGEFIRNLSIMSADFMMMGTKVTNLPVTRRCLFCLLKGGTGPASSTQQLYLRLKYTRQIEAAEEQPPLAEPPSRKQMLFLQMFLQMFRPGFFSFLFFTNGVKVQPSSAKFFCV